MPLSFEPMPRARAPLATFPTQPSFRAGGTVPQALSRHPALHGLPQATGEPSALEIAVRRTRSPQVAGKWWQREGISPGAEWALRERQLRSPGREEMSGRGWAWARETGGHQSTGRARGPGGAEIQALPQRETASSPGGGGITPRRPQASARPALPGGRARRRRGRGDPSAPRLPRPRLPPARPRARSPGHAAGRGPRPPGRDRAESPVATAGAGSARASGESGAGDRAWLRLTPSALRMRERPGPRPLQDRRSQGTA